MATADAMYPRVSAFAERSVSGERALTLLHSMAWLSPAYSAAGQSVGPLPAAGEVSADPSTATEAGRWLRGHRRGLLAPLGAGTIDQALSAVLPVTHNALRLFGLSDKVFVAKAANGASASSGWVRLPSTAPCSHEALRRPCQSQHRAGVGTG